MSQYVVLNAVRVTNTYAQEDVIATKLICSSCFEHIIGQGASTLKTHEIIIHFSLMDASATLDWVNCQYVAAT